MLTPFSSHRGGKAARSPGPGHGIEYGRAGPTEERGIGGSAEPQGQDRDGREGRILHQPR